MGLGCFDKGVCKLEIRVEVLQPTKDRVWMERMLEQVGYPAVPFPLSFRTSRRRKKATYLFAPAVMGEPHVTLRNVRPALDLSRQHAFSDRAEWLWAIPEAKEKKQENEKGTKGS